jgi:hypothetical protein
MNSDVVGEPGGRDRTPFQKLQVEKGLSTGESEALQCGQDLIVAREGLRNRWDHDRPPDGEPGNG